MTARSTVEVRRLDPTGITAFRQADVGEYLREVFQQFLRIPNAVTSKLTLALGGHPLLMKNLFSWRCLPKVYDIIDIRETNYSINNAISLFHIEGSGCIIREREREWA